MAAAANAPEKVYVFILLLDRRKFETVGRICTHGRSYESGDPIMWFGKEAAILGVGLTRSEAKKKGTQYYNQVCEMHKDEGGWEFDTQPLDEEEPWGSAHQYGPARKRPRTD